MQKTYTIAIALTVILVAFGAFWFNQDNLSRESSELNGEREPVAVALSQPPLIVPIIGGNRETFGERLRSVHQLSRQLTNEEIERVYSFLQGKPSAEEKIRGWERVLKNDILNALRSQAIPPEGLTELMIGLYEDQSQDSVIRDYAIQHLACWYEVASADRDQIKTVLMQATEANWSVAGTALMGLHRLSEPGRESDYISDTSLRLVNSKDVNEASLITAIQVCSERQLAEALPVIEELAIQGQSVSVRISAIAALGNLGSERHIRLLESFHTEERTKRAAMVALEKLQNREMIN